MGNSTFQIECIKMFVNRACGRLELIFYDHLIKNKYKCYYDIKTVLPFAFYRTMKVIDSKSRVVIFHRWLCIASFIANSSNDSTCGNELEHRNCIMHDVLMQNILTGWTSCWR